MRAGLDAAGEMGCRFIRVALIRLPLGRFSARSSSLVPPAPRSTWPRAAHRKNGKAKYIGGIERILSNHYCPQAVVIGKRRERRRASRNEALSLAVRQGIAGPGVQSSP